MNRRAYRILMAFAIISIAGTLAVQFYWMYQAFSVRDQGFAKKVQVALYNTAIKLCDVNDKEIESFAVEQLSSNLFVVNVNNKINPESLENTLTATLNVGGIVEDFEYGVYDCSTEAMVYGSYVNMELPKANTEKAFFPHLDKDEYYFGVYFPNRATSIAGQMGVWIFSSITLLLVTIFFAISLLFINRQRNLSEVQKDFVDNMTHEFKTPIATIALSAEVLKSDGINHDPERRYQYADIIDKEASRLKMQVERVLQMSNANQEGIILNKESVAITDWVKTYVDMRSFSDKELMINMHADHDIPNVHMDKLHMSNVIMSLLDNAIKYQSHEIKVVNVNLRLLEDNVEISIEDKGIGIEPKNLNKVFDKFYRIPTGNIHNVKGFGLGLYYAKQVVVAHKGSIAIMSVVNQGTKVTIKLPTI